MPRADRYISSLFNARDSKTVVRARYLAPIEILSLESASNADAGDLYFSACVTFLEAVRGAASGFFTWSAVKAYYSVFYAVRSKLSHDGGTVFHVGDGVYYVNTTDTRSPISAIGRGTHKMVLNMFSRNNHRHPILSQRIGLSSPFDWLLRLREDANYRRECFTEPDATPEFAMLLKTGVRKLLNAYMDDAADEYTFDADHAVLAFPLKLLRIIGGELKSSGCTNVNDERKHFLRTIARDHAGPVASLIAWLREVG